MPNSATKERPSQVRKPWATILPPSFWEYDLNDREKVVFLALDTFAREDPWSYPSYTSLAKLAKKTPRAIRDTIPDLERKGFIRTVHKTSKHSKRTGVIMLKRANPATPSAESPEEIAAAESALNSRKKGRKATKKWQPRLAEKCQHDVSRKDQGKRLQLEKLSPQVRDWIGSLATADDPDDVLLRMRGRVVDIARVLPSSPEVDKSRLVDDLAALTLTILVDHDGDESNVGSHYEMAQWVRDGEVSAVDVSDGLYEAVESVERGTGESGSALYRGHLLKRKKLPSRN